MKRITALLLVALLCSCETDRSGEQTSGPREMKSGYGIAVGKARDLKGKLETRDNEVEEQAEEFAE